MVEQRVIGQKIGARPAPATPVVPEKAPDASPALPEKKKRGRKGLVLAIVAVVVVLAVAAGGWLMLGKAHHGAAGAAKPKPAPTQVAGDVVSVDAVSVNLADGHYLRLGLALQMSTAAKEDPNPSRALDLAIALYSGRSVDEVSSAPSRDKLKAELLAELRKAYGPEVMDVYLTDYVTQ